jgi:hypothetical protein
MANKHGQRSLNEAPHLAKRRKSDKELVPLAAFPAAMKAAGQASE